MRTLTLNFIRGMALTAFFCYLLPSCKRKTEDPVHSPAAGKVTDASFKATFALYDFDPSNGSLTRGETVSTPVPALNSTVPQVDGDGRGYVDLPYTVKSDLLDQGAIFVSVIGAGFLYDMNGVPTQWGKKGCYPYAMIQGEEEPVIFISETANRIEETIDPLFSSLSILASGKLCTNEAGQLTEVNNESEFDLLEASNYNFANYLDEQSQNGKQQLGITGSIAGLVEGFGRGRKKVDDMPVEPKNVKIKEPEPAAVKKEPSDEMKSAGDDAGNVVRSTSSRRPGLIRRVSSRRITGRVEAKKADGDLSSTSSGEIESNVVADALATPVRVKRTMTRSVSQRLFKTMRPSPRSLSDSLQTALKNNEVSKGIETLTEQVRKQKREIDELKDQVKALDAKKDADEIKRIQTEIDKKQVELKSQNNLAISDKLNISFLDKSADAVIYTLKGKHNGEDVNIVLKKFSGEGEGEDLVASRAATYEGEMSQRFSEIDGFMENYGFFTDAKGNTYIMNQYLDSSLDDLLQSGNLGANVQRYDSPNDIKRYTSEFLDTIARAHEKGLAHGDIKPDNIRFLKNPDGTYSVRVFDFDKSLDINNQSLTPADSLKNNASTTEFIQTEEARLKFSETAFEKLSSDFTTPKLKAEFVENILNSARLQKIPGYNKDNYRSVFNDILDLRMQNAKKDGLRPVSTKEKNQFLEELGLKEKGRQYSEKELKALNANWALITRSVDEQFTKVVDSAVVRKAAIEKRWPQEKFGDDFEKRLKKIEDSAGLGETLYHMWAREPLAHNSRCSACWYNSGGNTGSGFVAHEIQSFLDDEIKILNQSKAGKTGDELKFIEDKIKVFGYIKTLYDPPSIRKTPEEIAALYKKEIL